MLISAWVFLSVMFLLPGRAFRDMIASSCEIFASLFPSKPHFSISHCNFRKPIIFSFPLSKHGLSKAQTRSVGHRVPQDTPVWAAARRGAPAHSRWITEAAQAYDRAKRRGDN